MVTLSEEIAHTVRAERRRLAAYCKQRTPAYELADTSLGALCLTAPSDVGECAFFNKALEP